MQGPEAQREKAWHWRNWKKWWWERGEQRGTGEGPHVRRCKALGPEPQPACQSPWWCKDVPEHVAAFQIKSKDTNKQSNSTYIKVVLYNLSSIWSHLEFVNLCWSKIREKEKD